jgi:predicted TIM-barrel fold metal-dependent hydrolase
MSPSRREALASGLALAAVAAVAATPAKAGGADDFKWFDGHLHLVSKDFQHYPLWSGPPPDGSLPPGAPPPPGASVQVGKPRIQPSAEQVVQWMDEQGVETLAAIQRRSSYGTDNRYVLDSADAHPGRFHAVVVLDAENPATPGQLRDWAKTHKIAGIRLTGAKSANGGYPWLDSPAALNTWRAVDDLGLAMDMAYAPQFFSADALEEILRTATRFPLVPIVLDHLGWPAVAGAPGYGFADYPAGLDRQHNVLFKFTTGNLNILDEAKIPSAAVLRRVVDRFGAHRVLWGSDMGSSAGTYAEMAQRARAAVADLTAQEQRHVLRETGRAVFLRGGGAHVTA